MSPALGFTSSSPHSIHLPLCCLQLKRWSLRDQLGLPVAMPSPPMDSSSGTISQNKRFLLQVVFAYGASPQTEKELIHVLWRKKLSMVGERHSKSCLNKVEVASVRVG